MQLTVSFQRRLFELVANLLLQHLRTNAIMSSNCSSCFEEKLYVDLESVESKELAVPLIYECTE